MNIFHAIFQMKLVVQYFNIVVVQYIQPTDKEEIANIISSLDSNKASGPNSISYRTLFLLKK